MSDRDFWIEIRRGLLNATWAIDRYGGDQYYREMAEGLKRVIRAIEDKWNLPRGSKVTIGSTNNRVDTPNTESALTTPARSTERIGHALQ